MSGSKGMGRALTAAATMGMSEVYRATAKAVLPKKDKSAQRRASLLVAERDALQEDLDLKTANQRSWTPRTVANVDTSLFTPSQASKKTLLGGY